VGTDGQKHPGRGQSSPTIGFGHPLRRWPSKSAHPRRRLILMLALSLPSINLNALSFRVPVKPARFAGLPQYRSLKERQRKTVRHPRSSSPFVIPVRHPRSSSRGSTRALARVDRRDLAFSHQPLTFGGALSERYCGVPSRGFKSTSRREIWNLRGKSAAGAREVSPGRKPWVPWVRNQK